MAGVLNDYVCAGHGNFESRTGKCPHGCSPKLVEIRFNKAPGMVTARTRGIDNTLRGLAKDHGLTNMNNHNGTTGAFIPDPNMGRAEQEMQRNIMAGQTYSAGMGDGNVASTLAASNLQGGNALNNDVVRSMIQPPRPNVVAAYNPKV